MRIEQNSGHARKNKCVCVLCLESNDSTLFQIFFSYFLSSFSLLKVILFFAQSVFFFALLKSFFFSLCRSFQQRGNLDWIYALNSLSYAFSILSFLHYQFSVNQILFYLFRISSSFLLSLQLQCNRRVFMQQALKITNRKWLKFLAFTATEVEFYVKR